MSMYSIKKLRRAERAGCSPYDDPYSTLLYKFYCYYPILIEYIEYNSI